MQFVLLDQQQQLEAFLWRSCVPYLEVQPTTHPILLRCIMIYFDLKDSKSCGDLVIIKSLCPVSAVAKHNLWLPWLHLLDSKYSVGQETHSTWLQCPEKQQGDDRNNGLIRQGRVCGLHLSLHACIIIIFIIIKQLLHRLTGLEAWWVTWENTDVPHFNDQTSHNAIWFFRL